MIRRRGGGGKNDGGTKEDKGAEFGGGRSGEEGMRGGGEGWEVVAPKMPRRNKTFTEQLKMNFP